MHSIPRKAGKEILRELAANIKKSAADLGIAHALRRLGSARAYARNLAVTEASASSPRWDQGRRAAAIVSALLLSAIFCATFGFADGARAAGATDLVFGELRFLPGVRVEYVENSTRLSAGISLNPLTMIIPGLLAFLIFAKPWRLIRSQNS